MQSSNGFRRAVGIVALCVVCAGGGALAARRENQPHMESALRSLQDARAELNRAENDKGGNRQRALDHVDKAIDAVKDGIKFANKH